MPVVAFVGAGSAEFTRQLVSDLLQERELGGLELKLMDESSARLVRAEAQVQDLIRLSGRLDVRSIAHHDLKDVIRGADYVINTVLVGGRDAVVRDFAVLERHRIRQTVGDTLGVSGIVRAVRTIPQIVKVAQVMEEVAPQAVLLNYTNPMSMLIMALRRTAVVEYYGLCHSAHYTAETLAGYLDVPPDELEWESCGINHMAWMLKLAHHGQDLYPLLRSRAEDPAIWERDAVRFELLKAFGCFVTESSKHAAEYFPYFLTHDDEVERLNIPLYEYVTRQRRAVEPMSSLLAPSGEYAPQFIRHREMKTPFTFQGNVANRSWIENLPPEAAVEVPCHMIAGAVYPQVMGLLPGPLAALNRQAATVQDLAVTAILEQDRVGLYQAVALDPQAGAVLTLHEMRTLVDNLLTANRDWVPEKLIAGL